MIAPRTSEIFAMRHAAALLLICLLAPAVLGQDAARRAQVGAANADAFETLRRQVLAMPLAPDMTVEKFLDRTNSRAEMEATLQGAEQIGSGRWLDEQTVQVRLEVRGSQVARTLQKIADQNSKTLPMSMRGFRDRLKQDFSSRTFAATGSSTAGNAADRLRPDASQVAWRAVSDKDRRAAIDAARKNAVDRVFDSLGPIEWDGKQRFADVLAAPATGDSIRAWFASRPVTSIEFRDDLEIRLSLSATPDDAWPALKTQLEKQTAVQPPRTEAEWVQLHRQVESRMVPPVGTAMAKSPAAPGVAPIPLPAQPPPWVQTALNTDGISPPVGSSKLKTARAAEAIALQHLRAQLGALPLNATTTLEDAAKIDPRVAEALARSLGQAHISKVDYDSPDRGSVRVRMVLDLGDVWNELGKR